MIRVPGRIRGPERHTPGKEHHRNPMAKERFTGILVPTILISVVLITLPAVFDYVAWFFLPPLPDKCKCQNIRVFL